MRKKYIRTAQLAVFSLIFSMIGCGGSLAAEYHAENGPDPAYKADKSRGADNFYTSSQVQIQKVQFKNQYGMTIAANLYTPKSLEENRKYPAIIVGAPMGAVKEQSAGLYAAKMAEKGYVTLAFDQSYWGESEGEPRGSVNTDIYAEAFSACADYLGTRPFVDRERIGVIGICGSGSFSIQAAKIDPRIKAVATVSMYDMGAATRWGLHRSQTREQQKELLAAAAQQRYAEFEGKDRVFTSGTPYTINEHSTPIEKEFFDFYRSDRGYSPNTTTMPTLTSNVKFMNFYPFEDMDLIAPRPVLFIAGDHAHSREFSEDAYQRAAEPKELYIVPQAGHVDLYDRTEVIPFDKLEEFFGKSI